MQMCEGLKFEYKLNRDEKNEIFTYYNLTYTVEVIDFQHQVARYRKALMQLSNAEYTMFQFNNRIQDFGLRCSCAAELNLSV